MTQLSGRRVLVTGASGLVALPVARELAKSNEVYAVARYSDPEQRRVLDEAGARTIAFDMAEKDLSPLPKEVDFVINYAVLPPTQKDHWEVNAGAAGRLARKYRDCTAFLHGSTGSLYHYQGERPLREEDEYGLHSGAEPYAASKIAAEFLLKHLSEDYQLPTVIVRIFSFYGPRGGGPTQRIDQIANGRPVMVYPGVRNVYSPMFEDDYVEKTIQALSIAKVPAEIVNLTGTDPMTTQEYCQLAAEMLGKEATFLETGTSWPIWGDSTKMEKLLGPCRVSMREGIRRVIESNQSGRVTTQHVIDEMKRPARA